jgi:hypothetical protein
MDLWHENESAPVYENFAFMFQAEERQTRRYVSTPTYFFGACASSGFWKQLELQTRKQNSRKD